MWNANCDATNPKSKMELKRELEIWERTQGGRATSSSATQMGVQIRGKDFDGKAWSTKHDADFQQLIANARRKQTKTPSSAATPPEAAGTATPNMEPATAGTDVTMRESEVDEPIVLRDTPEKSASQRIFFDESSSELPPSSQCQDKLGVLDKDAGIASDITT